MGSRWFVLSIDLGGDARATTGPLALSVISTAYENPDFRFFIRLVIITQSGSSDSDCILPIFVRSASVRSVATESMILSTKYVSSKHDTHYNNPTPYIRCKRIYLLRRPVHLTPLIITLCFRQISIIRCVGGTRHIR